MRQFTLLLLICLGTYPLLAVTVCHDYTWYRAFGQDVNHKSAESLRVELRSRKYKVFPFTNAAQSDAERANRFLRPGDIIILGEDHSAFVDDHGISHFLQLQGEIGKERKADALPAGAAGNAGGLWSNETLPQLLKHRINVHFPSVEVWRKA